ncbi:hypothetical protein KC19_8G188100 [Ceratodon purpureus]|uniref:Uncharacterized protein n=1 Tax=Ceratodon purpureus TaxID=3225 RepID=A0A8T0H249_CERPU|nr:hypothetical protein KC19_8G188100 [Ceratodon purpureus]
MRSPSKPAPVNVCSIPGFPASDGRPSAVFLAENSSRWDVLDVIKEVLMHGEFAS